MESVFGFKIFFIQLHCQWLIIPVPSFLYSSGNWGQGLTADRILMKPLNQSTWISPISHEKAHLLFICLLRSILRVCRMRQSSVCFVQIKIRNAIHQLLTLTGFSLIHVQSGHERRANVPRDYRWFRSSRCRVRSDSPLHRDRRNCFNSRGWGLFLWCDGARGAQRTVQRVGVLAGQVGGCFFLSLLFVGCVFFGGHELEDAVLFNKDTLVVGVTGVDCAVGVYNKRLVVLVGWGHVVEKIIWLA